MSIRKIDRQFKMEKKVLDGRGAIKFLEDRLVLNCRIEQSFGHPDEYVTKEIFYNSISNLPLEPENMQELYEDISRFPINIQQANKTIVFFISRRYDTDADPTHDETLHGPYLAR